MGDCMTCDSCGAILREREVSTSGVLGYELYCPNEECTGIFSLKDAIEKREKDNWGNALAALAEEDVVNEPNHYMIADIEAIDIIHSTLTDEAFAGYLMGNVLKYRLRAGKKGDTEQDIAKALKYEAWLVDMDND